MIIGFYKQKFCDLIILRALSDNGSAQEESLQDESVSHQIDWYVF